MAFNMKKQKPHYTQLRPLWTGVFSDIIGFTLLGPILPYLAEQFSVPIWVMGVLLSTNAIFGLIFGPILGKLSDKYGRKPLLFISQLGTFIGFLILAFSNSLQMIFISRIVDGIFGGNYPIAKAIITDVVKPMDRSDQMANVGVAHNLANLIAPGLSGILFSNFGLIAPGIIGAGLSLLTLITNIFWLEETAPIKDSKIKILDEIRVKDDMVQNSNVLHKMKKGNGENRSIWHNKTALILLIQWFFHTLAFMTFVTSRGFFAKDKLNLTPEQLGLLLSIAGGFQIFVKFIIFLPLMRRTGELLLTRIGLGLFIILFFIAGFVNDWLQFIFVMLLMSFAASSTRGILTSFLSRSVDRRDMGKVMGYNTSLDNISQVLGPLIGTFFISLINLNLFGFIPAILSVFAFGMSFLKIEFKYEHIKGPPEEKTIK